jgi:demethylmenaquinone methyltransferase / 2-methoxy-6-polyprenyl-1,4-benzoquinol methylase
MFDRIAHRYDLLNRILSLGQDQRWRRKTVRSLGLDRHPGTPRVLDVATGTADLALLIARRHPTARVDGLDPSPGMLEKGDHKVREAGLQDRVRLVTGDAQSLPYPDSTFHGVTIAFGIRNVPDRALGLAEMARVTAPGGRVAVLELSEPGAGPLGMVARFHVRHVVPRLGAILSGEREYRYLQSSIAAFPSAEVFAGMMRDVGLVNIRVHPLTLGVCHLYVGERAAAG